MTNKEKQRQGIKRNKLLRYQEIANYYLQVKKEHRYITTVEIHKSFIYPKYHISRTTLNTILGTPISKELKELEL